jgi:glyceraldehyde 3-phosphate dehydrogenase
MSQEHIVKSQITITNNFLKQETIMRIAINGFGRIGKTLLRTLLLDPQASPIDVVAINIGKGNMHLIAQTFKYDTLMGTLPMNVHVEDNMLCINDKKIELIAELDPTHINWKIRSIDWVIDASGHFTKHDKALLHISPAGAQHVLITAPAENPDTTIIPGINDNMYDESQKIVSLGSCTTNAAIPVLATLNASFDIIQCAMTTVHAYTNSQVLLDIEAGEARRSRAAALNIVPSSTGISKIVDSILPGMGSKFTATALRVPVARVSIIDLVFTSRDDLSVAKVNKALENATRTLPKKIMAYSTEPLVSSDYANDPHSVTIDSLLTSAQGNMAKVFGWYDNEWGYCQRVKDFLLDRL